MPKIIEIPIWKKCLLTIQEASAYSNIGTCKIRELANEKDCQFVLYVGNKKLIKREPFEEFLKQSYSL